jgi:excisionase family DNA binding protein
MWAEDQNPEFATSAVDAKGRRRKFTVGWRYTVEQLLSVRQAADLLRLHPKSVYALVARGSIPHVRIGRRVLFRPEDLRRWIGLRIEGH